MPLSKIHVAPGDRKVTTAAVRKDMKKLKAAQSKKSPTRKELSKPAMQVQQGISRGLNTHAHLQAGDSRRAVCV